MRLSALTTDALASLAADGKSPNTLLAYDVAFRLFVHFVTVTRNLPDDTKSFTPENVLLFKTALHEGDGKRGANPNTIRARLSSLAFLGEYATIRDAQRQAGVRDQPGERHQAPQAETPRGQVAPVRRVGEIQGSVTRPSVRDYSFAAL